jgi:hypothetical protein
MKSSLRYILLLAATVTVLSGVANAVPTLKIWDGTTTISVADASGLDQSSLAGTVLWSGSIGSWTVSVDTGFTKPTLGSAGHPVLDLSFSAVSATGGSLWIAFSEDGFTAPGSATGAIGGTASGSLSYQLFGGASDTVLDMSHSLSPSSTYSGPFSALISGSAVGAAPYSLTELVTIVQRTGGATSGDAMLTVPDSGTTVMLLGAALTILGLFVRSRKTA